MVDTYDPIDDPIVDDPIEDPTEDLIDDPIDDLINGPIDDPIDDPLDGRCRAVPIRMALHVQSRGPVICTNKSVNQPSHVGFPSIP